MVLVRQFVMIRVTAVAILILWSVTSCVVPDETKSSHSSDTKMKLRVLYAGVLNEPRAIDFADFLRKRFEHVGLVSYSAFNPADADGYDVVVLDGEPQVEENKSRLLNPPVLPQDFNRATVLVGRGGVLAAMPLKLKLNFLCMCLGKSAHGTMEQHELFKKPSPISLTHHSIPPPREYAMSGSGDNLEVWDVQTTDYRDKNSGLVPGVVSSGAGFLDSPDVEFISGGLNTKAEDAVAIGRQGPFLLWGFSAPPKDMTPSGRNAFANAITYISAFDRSEVLVRKIASSRELALQRVHYICSLEKAYAMECEYYRSHNLRRKSLIEDGKHRALTDEEKAIIGSSDITPPSFESFRESELRIHFPQELVDSFGHDCGKYKAYYNENYPFLVFEKDMFNIDPDSKAIGIANSDITLLDACIVALEKDAGDARAQRLLARYTCENFRTPAEWRRWLNSNRSSLFFSDVGGFRFCSSASTEEVSRRRLLARTIPTPSDSKPVVCSAEISPSSGLPGQVAVLAIRLRIAPGWHISAGSSQSPSTNILKIESAPHPSLAYGQWIWPPPVPVGPGTTGYTGDIVICRRVTLGQVQPDNITFTVSLSFQACNRERCLLPYSESFQLSVEVLKTTNDD